MFFKSCHLWTSSKWKLLWLIFFYSFISEFLPLPPCHHTNALSFRFSIVPSRITVSLFTKPVSLLISFSSIKDNAYLCLYIRPSSFNYLLRMQVVFCFPKFLTALGISPLLHVWHLFSHEVLYLLSLQTTSPFSSRS